MNGVMSKAKKDVVKTPAGLTIRRQGEALETVSSKAGLFRLLVSHSRSEITEINLNKGSRFIITPADSVIETFYVLSGQLISEQFENHNLIEQGSYIVTDRLSEDYIFTASKNTRLLHITERPQFHTFSENISQLRELAVEVEVKDGYTADHCERLQNLSYATGQELGLSPANLYLLDIGAYLHDVGKIRVPLSILNKPAKLTPDEWEVIKKHPLYGRELLDQTFMKEASTIVEQHHERLDGSGYPYGLSGNDLLIEASIVAVADTFDAMTTNRPYHKAATQAEALAEIQKYAGIHYPKEVVKAFCSALRAGKIIKKNQ